MPARGPAHLSPARLGALIALHRRRFIIFGMIGGLVFLLQFVLQVIMVRIWHVGPIASYIMLGIGCIQLNFLLNRRFTWRDRQVSAWIACCKFNAQKLISATVNFALYSGLIELRMNYLLANALTIGLFTIINYALGNVWAFTS